MTTVYFICVFFAVDLVCAHREHRHGVRRGAFSTRRNFLATCIRQRQCFGLLRGAVEALPSAVLLPVVAETPLVASARGAMTGRSSFVAAVIAAVVVAAIISPAHDEGHDTPQATQLVNGNGVQGSGCSRQKLGRGPEPWEVWLVESPALGLRPKARARDSGLHSFRCAEIIPSRNSSGHFSTRGLPVSGDPGGSGPQRARW
jgi:hypothetical protein